ncbi:MAG: hypothetical protein ACP5GH_00195 [Nitrososphaeria archaeon]
MKRYIPLLYISLSVIVTWLLLIASFYLMKQALLLTDGLRGVVMEMIRDLIGIAVLTIWVIVFYLIREFVSRRLLR